MITQVDIRGFKRFVHAQIKMAPLTVLAGLNGSGKTSLLQSVLIAAEASRTKSAAISLNGPFDLELGTANDVLNWKSQSPIEITFETTKTETATWRFKVSSDEALYLDIAEQPERLPKAFSGAPRAFTYLCAERLGPRGFSATSSLPEAELEVGVKGEFCAHVLSILGGKLLRSAERKHPLSGSASPQLLNYEVEQWLSEITRPIQVTGERVSDSTVAELRFRTLGSASGPEWVRSTNMGFGITYTLPIILAGLIAEKGGLLVVENPEAHLHPAGQSRMGVFLAWLAGRGVQVLVETHSDHIINGIRRAVAEHNYLDSASALFYWFGDDDDSVFSTMTIGETGSLSKWPEGFFDQYQIDVAALGQIRRSDRKKRLDAHKSGA